MFLPELLGREFEAAPEQAVHLADAEAAYDGGLLGVVAMTGGGKEMVVAPFDPFIYRLGQPWNKFDLPKVLKYHIVGQRGKPQAFRHSFLREDYDCHLAQRDLDVLEMLRTKHQGKHGVHVQRILVGKPYMAVDVEHLERAVDDFQAELNEGRNGKDSPARQIELLPAAKCRGCPLRHMHEVVIVVDAEPPLAPPADILSDIDGAERDELKLVF